MVLFFFAYITLNQQLCLAVLGWAPGDCSPQWQNLTQAARRPLVAGNQESAEVKEHNGLVVASLRLCFPKVLDQSGWQSQAGPAICRSI